MRSRRYHEVARYHEVMRSHTRAGVKAVGGKSVIITDLELRRYHEVMRSHAHAGVTRAVDGTMSVSLAKPRARG